jgi:hypothetical protein
LFSPELDESIKQGRETENDMFVALVVTAVMCMRKFIHSYQVLQLHMSFGLLNN